MPNLLNQTATKLLVIYPNKSQAQQVASWLLTEITGVTHAQLLINDPVLTTSQSILLENWLKQLIQEHKPLAYILGHVPFLDLDILVQPPILIPRLETEWWVNLLIQGFANFKNERLKILDLCSGSGCIGLALASAFAKSQVYLVDILPAACDLISKNAQHNQLTNVIILESDLYQDFINQKSGIKFDLIIANPPYIPAADYQNLDLSVRLWEDRLALVAQGSDLGVIAKIISLAPHYLESDLFGLPQLWLEIDATQGHSAGDLMRANFNQVDLIEDQFGKNRVIVGKN